MKKIGLFGVTGNPPHMGHYKVVKEALDARDEVWVTPVFIHPFGKSFIDYEKRLFMLNILFSKIGRVKIVELDKEFYDNNNRTPYSYDLLNYMKAKNNKTNPILIIGEDNYKEEVWKKFFAYDKIEKEFGVIVIKDFGMHSTQIRELCLNKEWEKVKELCGKEIAKYLKDNLIYGV